MDQVAEQPITGESSAVSQTVSQYWLTRIVLLRGLGLIYLVAFYSLAKQQSALFGSDGLLPIQLYLSRAENVYAGSSYSSLPSIFWLNSSDIALTIAAWFGVVLSLLLLAGRANSIMLFLLWLLYLSFVNTGQIFYGYGWETLLLEAGFLAIFFVPLLFWRSPYKTLPPSTTIIWLYRWLAFRVMFGAGLIKLRAADSCWREFKCLLYHYETQPLPNPLSWYLHNMPPWFHQFGVSVNHFVEIIVPFLFFAPRRLRHFGASATILFQLMLIFSGNLSWLNYLTIVVCLPCYDDNFFRRLWPNSWTPCTADLQLIVASKSARAVNYILVAGILLLSIEPALNLFSPQQKMNASFEPFHLVNTYGAFGSVGKERYEIVLEGTDSADPSEGSDWKEYEFICKPGVVDRRPCVIAPYQSRIDWQIWFAAMSTFNRNPWLIHLVAKLLSGNKEVAELLEYNPFESQPPKYIRGVYYRYQFTSRQEDSAAWWKRKREGLYFPALSLEDPRLKQYLHSQGW